MFVQPTREGILGIASGFDALLNPIREAQQGKKQNEQKALEQAELGKDKAALEQVVGGPQTGTPMNLETPELGSSGPGFGGMQGFSLGGAEGLDPATMQMALRFAPLLMGKPPI